MTSRVASNAAVGLISWDLSQSAQRMMTIQDQIASGKRIRLASDDPSGTASAMGNRAQMRRTEQQTANATDATGWLNLTDSALQDVQTQLQVAKQRAIQTVNGALDDNAREGIAIDIDGLRGALLQLANTTYQNRSIFAGTVAGGTPAYDGTGAYQGDAGAVRRTIADGVTVQVNTSGPALFGAPDALNPMDGDVFQVLDALATAVRNNDTAAVNVAMGKLDGAMSRVAITQTRVGAMSQQVEATVNRNEGVLLDVKERLSMIEDVDPAQAIIDFRVQENAYQAALAVTAKVIQPSLVDFLR
jgi:flagellar hook-associated protein 3 FlgL